MFLLLIYCYLLQKNYFFGASAFQLYLFLSDFNFNLNRMGWFRYRLHPFALRVISLFPHGYFKSCLTHLMVPVGNSELVISERPAKRKPKISIRILDYYWPTLLLQANNIFLQSRVKRVIGWELPRISSLNSPCFTGCMNTFACPNAKRKFRRIDCEYQNSRLIIVRFITCLRCAPIFALIR